MSLDYGYVSMSESDYDSAFEEAEKLKDYNEEVLYEQLGLRILDIINIGGYERSKKYTAEFTQVAEDMGIIDDLKAFGRRWWRKLEPQLMSLVCDENNEEMKKITGDKTIPQIAASLATSAVILALAPPAWIIVATTILAHKLAKSGIDTLCELWRE